MWHCQDNAGVVLIVLLLQVGSCVLFGLFLCFRYLPKWLVNLLLSGYITLLGAFAINAVALPFVNQLFSEATQHKVRPH
jgi:minor histocompatibility antigen H13